MLRKEYIENNTKDENLFYRGEVNTRLYNLTDAVFGIALALLIFNVSEANHFKDLLTFAKSFPALLLSIAFLYIIWKEHVSYSVIYGIQGVGLQFLNIIFTSLVIFYVYPLRFLTRLLTSMLFNFEIELKIEGYEIPQLMIFYGMISFAMYITMSLFYILALKQRATLNLSRYEIFHAKQHRNRMFIMASVPFVSLSVSYIIQHFSILLASILGGVAYGLYPIFIEFWRRVYKRKKSEVLGT